MRLTMRIAVLLGFALLLLVAPGCPDAEELVIDAGRLTLRVQTVNTSGLRFEMAQLRIVQIQYEPADPDAAQGPRLSGTFTFPEIIDITGPSVEVPAGTLNEGDYIVRRMVISNLSLRDDDPGSPPSTCIEGVVNPGTDGVLATADDFGVLPDLRFPVVFPSSITYPNLGDPVFSVPAGGGYLNLTIDVGLLISAYENAFTCFASTNGTCNTTSGPVRSTNCTNSFNANGFIAASAAAYTFN